MTRVVYLHGFASSPHSSKAQFFRRRFAASGVPMEIPRLDEGRFEELTISAQLRVIERAVGEEPAILMGSSWEATSRLCMRRVMSTRSKN